MGFCARQNFRRIVVEDQAEQAAERITVSNMHPQNERRMVAPRELFGRRLPREPPLLAKYVRHIGPGERVYPIGGAVRCLVRSHQRDSTAHSDPTSRGVWEVTAPQSSPPHAQRWLRRVQSRL